LDTTIRIFRERMKLIPSDELRCANAKIEATVRNQHGLPRRQTLAIWNGGDPLPSFFAAAKVSWKRLPKEERDQNTTNAIEPNVV
jgi:hypothetical protein